MDEIFALEAPVCAADVLLLSLVVMSTSSWGLKKHGFDVLLLLGLVGAENFRSHEGACKKRGQDEADRSNKQMITIISRPPSQK